MTDHHKALQAAREANRVPRGTTPAILAVLLGVGILGLSIMIGYGLLTGDPTVVQFLGGIR